MKIVFAKNIGFCSGVKRAVLIAENSLKKDPKPIQFLGNLVHNEKIIEKFKKRGVKFIKNLKSEFYSRNRTNDEKSAKRSLSAAKKGTIIIQAHGISPFSKKNKKELVIKDATCPLVKKAQIAAKSFYEKGYKVVIIGDKNHSEVKGIKAWSKNQALIIECENQAKTPQFLKKVGNNKIGVVAQTTQNLDNVNKILRALKSKTKKLEYLNTLCPEVQKRQNEMESILKKVDSVIVIGSKSSANTKRLVEKAEGNKKQVFWVNSLLELKKEFKKQKIKKIFSLGVISGASASNEEIEKIKKWLKKLK